MVVRYKPKNGLRRKDYFVKVTPISVARDLIERFHYAHGAANTAVYIHGLYRRDNPSECLGVCWWMPPIKQAALSAAGEDWRAVLALSRTVLVPWAPPNSATFLVNGSIRKIRADRRYLYLLSFADEYMAQHPERPGVIYWAANFEYTGRTKAAITWVDPSTGRQVSAKAGPKTRNHTEMLALGYIVAGRYAKHRFFWDFRARREQILRMREHPVGRQLSIFNYAA